MEFNIYQKALFDKSESVVLFLNNSFSNVTEFILMIWNKPDQGQIHVSYE